MSFTSPATRFPADQARRHRIEILVRVWLLIAGFYRRAEMYEDAKGAIDEAYKLVEALEEDVAKDSTGKVSIDNPGWGIGKSIEELWGDVWSERGHLSTARSFPYIALSDFETALTHFSDHPCAIVGLSNILLDIYSEALPPPPSIAPLVIVGQHSPPSSTNLNSSTSSSIPTPAPLTASPTSSTLNTIPPGPLGLPTTSPPNRHAHSIDRHPSASTLDPPHRASSTALLDRLAARDRAYGLLSGLTKLGTGWNYSEAWYALSRAYEEGGQVDKAREVLWWCVELEEGKGVRDWGCVGVGGYVL